MLGFLGKNEGLMPVAGETRLPASGAPASNTPDPDVVDAEIDAFLDSLTPAELLALKAELIEADRLEGTTNVSAMTSEQFLAFLDRR